MMRCLRQFKTLGAALNTETLAFSIAQTRNVAVSPEESEQDEEPYRRRKQRGTKFRMPPGHVKASGTILCIAPVLGSVNKTDKADDLTELRKQLKKVLDLEGLLFLGASINGRAMGRMEVKEWLELDPSETRVLVPSTLTRHLASKLSVIDTTGQRFLQNLVGVQQSLLQILAQIENVKRDS